MKRAKGVVLLFVIGAVMLSIFDMFHTHGGVTEYAHVIAWKMAWWTPLAFGSSLAFGGLAYRAGHRAMRGDPELPSNAALAAALVIYAGLYCASGYLPASNEGKLALLLVGFAGLWWLLDRSWQGMVMAAVAAIGGCLTEFVLTQRGVFRHLQPDVIGLPVWLPALYLASGTVLGQLSRKVLSRRPWV